MGIEVESRFIATMCIVESRFIATMIKRFVDFVEGDEARFYLVRR